MKALAVISLLLAGCAAVGPVTRAPDRTELTREEIERTSFGNALDLVSSERPHWLRMRGRTSFTNESTVGIYLDGVWAGGPEYLRLVVPQDIERIRYYDAREAQFRFGLGHAHGALNLIMRR